MSIELYFKIFIGYLVLSGFLKSAVVTTMYFLDLGERGENHIKKMSNIGGFFDVFSVLVFLIYAWVYESPKVVSFGDLLNIHSDFIFYTDPISILYLLVSFLIIGLVGRFSGFYLHKDLHYYKFFSLFYIFQSASVLLLLSDNFASYFIGWELLGVSSVLLISFYNKRLSPVKNSLRIFSLYKISDILLFGGFAFAYSHTEMQLFSEFSSMDQGILSVYMLLTSLAIMVKMGGFPVLWLPRAMEGPTPSSAIFYGALATHIPLLMFIRIWSNVHVGNWVYAVLIALNLLIVLASTLLSRVQTDAKNSLAYATIKNLAIISIEVLLGFTVLAYIHTLLHCFYRLSQFIKTPSLLYETHQAEGYRGESFKDSGGHYEKFLPEKLRSSIYRFALREFYILPRLYRDIDILISLPEKTTTKKLMEIALFNFLLFLGLLGLEWLELHEIHSTLFLLAPAWIFSLVTLLLNYHDWRYIYVALLSIISLASVVFYVDGFLNFINLILLQGFLFLILKISFLFKGVKKEQGVSSEKSKILVFILGLWLVGVPGPGTYYLFEKAIHLSMEKDMYLAVGAFVILSINTLGVVKHYSLACLENRRGLT